MVYPLISIAIATINSEKTLSKTLDSIKKQSYPKNKIEVLVIDGGSKDKTKKIAKKYGCTILDNPGVGFIPGKHMGFLKARGDYVMYLDSDEELDNSDSLKRKISAFVSDKRIKAVISTGYKNPKNFPFINRYINEFGDPFSFSSIDPPKALNYFLKNF